MAKNRRGSRKTRAASKRKRVAVSKTDVAAVHDLPTPKRAKQEQSQLNMAFRESDSDVDDVSFSVRDENEDDVSGPVEMNSSEQRSADEESEDDIGDAKERELGQVYGYFPVPIVNAKCACNPKSQLEVMRELFEGFKMPMPQTYLRASFLMSPVGLDLHYRPAPSNYSLPEHFFDDCNALCVWTVAAGRTGITPKIGMPPGATIHATFYYESGAEFMWRVACVLVGNRTGISKGYAVREFQYIATTLKKLELALIPAVTEEQIKELEEQEKCLKFHVNVWNGDA